MLQGISAIFSCPQTILTDTTKQRKGTVSTIMGKGNRTRADQEAKQLAAAQKKQAQAEAQKKAKRNKVIGIVCAVLAVALIGSTLAYNKMVSSGFFMRQTTVASTENYSLDQTHASYFYNSAYSNFMNTYGDMASYFGLDTSKSLKSQSCMMLESGTWFDYFMSSAQSDMKSVLLFAEEAKARGLELDAEDRAQIKDALKSLKLGFACNESMESGKVIYFDN